ncbi:MAG: hypothetical protein ACR2N1_02945 [Rubripirellula sp.]
MNCSDYKLTITLLLTLMVFCGGDTDAVGQVQDTEVVQTESPGAKIAEPAELLGDTRGNRSTLTPLLGSPQAIAIPTSGPATRPAATADSPPATEATRVPAAAPQQTSGGSPQQTSGGLPERGQGTPPKADGEDYWKPVPAKTETVEYEKLDAETSRDLFNADSIRNLRKPMSDIRIVAEDDADAPQNLASRFMVKEPVLKIVAAGISPPRPDRYPIVFKHRPLYYEQALLERCGRGCGIAQNAISAGQFCMNTFFLPYHMCKTKPGCPVASGGDCLSCKPYSLDCNVLPLSYKGMATEAAAFAGFTFLLL